MANCCWSCRSYRNAGRCDACVAFPEAEVNHPSLEGLAKRPNQFQHYQRKWRIHRAKNIMRSKLEGSLLTIPTGIHSSCLAENDRSSKRNMLGNITPEKPSWLNDYYVASALESLWRENKIVKATKFELNGFPPRPGSYQFSTVKEGTTAKQQAEEIETDSQCLVNQIFRQCLKDDRYDSRVHSETTGPGTVRHGNTYHLKGDAPPCTVVGKLSNSKATSGYW